MYYFCIVYSVDNLFPPESYNMYDVDFFLVVIRCQICCIALCVLQTSKQVWVFLFCQLSDLSGNTFPPKSYNMYGMSTFLLSGDSLPNLYRAMRFANFKASLGFSILSII